MIGSVNTLAESDVPWDPASPSLHLFPFLCVPLFCLLPISSSIPPGSPPAPNHEFCRSSSSPVDSTEQTMSGRPYLIWARDGSGGGVPWWLWPDDDSPALADEGWWPQFVRGRRDGRSRRRQRLDQRLDVLVLTDINQALEKKMSGEEERREKEQCAGNECACLRQMITKEEIREPDLSCRLSNQKTSYTNARIMVSNISYKLSKPLCLSKMAIILKYSCKSNSCSHKIQRH